MLLKVGGYNVTFGQNQYQRQNAYYKRGVVVKNALFVFAIKIELFKITVFSF